MLVLRWFFASFECGSRCFSSVWGGVGGPVQDSSWTFVKNRSESVRSDSYGSGPMPRGRLSSPSTASVNPPVDETWPKPSVWTGAPAKPSQPAGSAVSVATVPPPTRRSVHGSGR
ncbi:hypothetical protein GCM10010405_05420 [Streptomyces macrosporus]|uniref:Secreted protein n=1 Tax=Streptomyces macrosporus TaxID=44032 RepID=A0ABP5WER2_9ACTN